MKLPCPSLSNKGAEKCEAKTEVAMPRRRGSVFLEKLVQGRDGSIG